MHNNFALITTIVAALGFGLLFGLIAVRLKLPALVGYLAAGILIGPSTPGFVADTALTRELAEIGVMLLMFGVGLHFSLSDLLKVRRIAVPGAILQILVATAMGMGLAHFWGWSLAAGIVFGLSLSVASTVVLIRNLEDRGILKSLNGQIAMGWLVVEDLVMVLVLVLLPALSETLTIHDEPIITTLLTTCAQVAMFIIFMLVIGRKLFPWFLWRVARTGSRELFTLTVIAAAVGVAYGSSLFFGVSFALGAFFAGMVLGKSELSHRAAEESLPFRDAFSVLFFVSVGMLFEPQVLISHPMHVLAVVLVIIFGKSIAAFLLVLALRYPLGTALTVSASLAQIGEFSFILAARGTSIGFLSNEAQSLILAGSLISITLNPLLFKTVTPLQRWIENNFGKKAEYADDPLAELPSASDQKTVTVQVVLIGYGDVGRKITEYLNEHSIQFIVVERNRDLVEHLRRRGLTAVTGNAVEPSVLVQAHISKASALILAMPDAFDVRAIVETARALNPTITSLIRTHSEADAHLFRKENMGQVFLGEHELASAMARSIIETLGQKQLNK